MINEQDKQRIEKEAFLSSENPYRGLATYNYIFRIGYITGATAEHELLTPQLEYANRTIKEFSDELKRSEKLLEEYREVIRRLLPLADGMVFEMRGTVDDDVTQKCENIVERAKSLIETTSKPEKE